MNQPREIGLLFTPENRSLWRQDLKLQTRRGMKVQPVAQIDPVYVEAVSAWQWMSAEDRQRSPYGNPQAEPVIYYPKEPVQVLELIDGAILNALIRYTDTGDEARVIITPGDYHKLLARQDWRKPSSPMFMLKSFARDKRRGVRVWPERLGDMSAADAIDEGIKALSKDGGQTIKYGLPDVDGLLGAMPWQDWQLTPVDAYRKVWESINGPNSWQPKTWVWCIEWEPAP